uniref:MADF domain-containing protein n=1 Tax=Trichogramma kaykai TaxID=54128 RepID=A0ABD2VV18_9HYME
MVSQYYDIIINLVKPCPWLYDKTQKNITSKEKNTMTWNEIADTINRNCFRAVPGAVYLTGNEVMAIWENLFDNYKAQYQKMKNQKSGSGQMNSSFPYMDEMSFLEPHIQHRPVLSSLKMSNLGRHQPKQTAPLGMNSNGNASNQPWQAAPLGMNSNGNASNQPWQAAPLGMNSNGNTSNQPWQAAPLGMNSNGNTSNQPWLAAPLGMNSNGNASNQPWQAGPFGMMNGNGNASNQPWQAGPFGINSNVATINQPWQAGSSGMFSLVAPPPNQVWQVGPSGIITNVTNQPWQVGPSGIIPLVPPTNHPWQCSSGVLSLVTPPSNQLWQAGPSGMNSNVTKTNEPMQAGPSRMDSNKISLNQTMQAGPSGMQDYKSLSKKRGLMSPAADDYVLKKKKIQDDSVTAVNKEMLNVLKQFQVILSADNLMSKTPSSKTNNNYEEILMQAFAKVPQDEMSNCLEKILDNLKIFKNIVEEN